jgi:hypothetical protein
MDYKATTSKEIILVAEIDLSLLKELYSFETVKKPKRETKIFL